MKLYLCKWPNGDCTLIAADSDTDLHDKLDMEDTPGAAEFVKLGSGTHLALEIVDGKIRVSNLDERADPDNVKWQKVKFGEKEFVEMIESWGAPLKP